MKRQEKAKEIGRRVCRMEEDTKKGNDDKRLQRRKAMVTTEE